MSSKYPPVEESLIQAETAQSEYRKKANDVYQDKINTQYEEMQHRKQEIDTINNIDLSFEARMRDIGKVQTENNEYLKYAKQCGVFINNDFKGKVPFFPQNLIFIGARTGEGKSTTAANLALQTIRQPGHHVLVLTNEEKKADFYNRITCLIKKWSYTNHELFTNEQIQIFTDNIKLLAHRLAVVDDNYLDGSGHTTTLEGITSLLDSLIKKNNTYHLIIIDYYQNITRSTKNPNLKDWEVQARLAQYLDQFKNRYLAPIVILGQLRPNSDGKMTFKEKIEGRKVILNKATCAIEMEAQREYLRTAWHIKKSRFPDTVGLTIYTGYHRGEFVEYTPEFKNEAACLVEAKRESNLKFAFANDHEDQETKKGEKNDK